MTKTILTNNNIKNDVITTKTTRESSQQQKYWNGYNKYCDQREDPSNCTTTTGNDLHQPSSSLFKLSSVKNSSTSSILSDAGFKSSNGSITTPTGLGCTTFLSTKNHSFYKASSCSNNGSSYSLKKKFSKTKSKTYNETECNTIHKELHEEDNASKLFQYKKNVKKDFNPTATTNSDIITNNHNKEFNNHQFHYHQQQQQHNPYKPNSFNIKNSTPFTNKSNSTKTATGTISSTETTGSRFSPSTIKSTTARTTNNSNSRIPTAPPIESEAKNFQLSSTVQTTSKAAIPTTLSSDFQKISKNPSNHKKFQYHFPHQNIIGSYNQQKNQIFSTTQNINNICNISNNNNIHQINTGNLYTSNINSKNNIITKSATTYQHHQQQNPLLSTSSSLSVLKNNSKIFIPSSSRKVATPTKTTRTAILSSNSKTNPSTVPTTTTTETETIIANNRNKQNQEISLSSSLYYHHKRQAENENIIIRLQEQKHQEQQQPQQQIPNQEKEREIEFSTKKQQHHQQQLEQCHYIFYEGQEFNDDDDDNDDLYHNQYQFYRNSNQTNSYHHHQPEDQSYYESNQSCNSSNNNIEIETLPPPRIFIVNEKFNEYNKETKTTKTTTATSGFVNSYSSGGSLTKKTKTKSKIYGFMKDFLKKKFCNNTNSLNLNKEEGIYVELPNNINVISSNFVNNSNWNHNNNNNNNSNSNRNSYNINHSINNNSNSNNNKSKNKSNKYDNKINKRFDVMQDVRLRFELQPTQQQQLPPSSATINPIQTTSISHQLQHQQQQTQNCIGTTNNQVTAAAVAAAAAAVAVQQQQQQLQQQQHSLIHQLQLNHHGSPNRLQQNCRPIHLFQTQTNHCNNANSDSSSGGDGDNAGQQSPQSPSSEEDNSPTEMNNCRRLGDKPPLVKRLTMGFLKSTEDSRPLVHIHSTSGSGTNCTPSRTTSDGYVNEAICEPEKLISSKFGDSCRQSLTALPMLDSRHYHENHSEFNFKKKYLRETSSANSSPKMYAPSQVPLRMDTLSLAEQNELRGAPWFQAGIPREISLEVLSKQNPGAFLVRQSSTKPGCFALSLRCPPPAAKVAHYLILRTPRGYKIKGFTKEFTSLRALITHHSVMPELLPVPLALPRPHHNFQSSRRHCDDFDTYDSLDDLRKQMSEI